MILASIFKKRPQTQDVEGSSQNEASDAGSDWRVMAERIARDTIKRAAAPSVGWIAQSVANELYSEHIQKIAAVAKEKPFPEVMVSISDAISRSSDADYERLSEIVNQQQLCPMCDFLDRLPPTDLAYSSGQKSMLTTFYRFNCPVIYADRRAETVVLGALNPVAGNELKRWCGNLSGVSLVSVMRLTVKDWHKAMAATATIVLP